MSQHPDCLSQFAHFSVRYGGRYLACGGPASRLEERLALVGTRFGFRTEVFATPTGLFVTVHAQVRGAGVGEVPAPRSVTLLERVKEGAIRLDEVKRLEDLLDGLHQGTLTLTNVLTQVEAPIAARGEYESWLLYGAAFLLGAGASLSRYGWGSGKGVILSGLITVLSYGLSRRLERTLRISGILCDFFCCLAALIAAGLCTQWLRLPFQALSIGTFVLLAPGLTLTIAISELANHDFISGTSKMMKGILTLLAMGTGYALYEQWSHAWRPALRPEMIAAVPPVLQNGLIAVGCTVAMVAAFSVILHVPRRDLPWAIVVGVSGAALFATFDNPKLFVVAAFLGSLVVGTLSLLFGWLFRQPSQIYSVPGILSLLPGMLALSSFHSLTDGQGADGIDLAGRVGLVAGAIVFGLFTARLPFLRSRQA